MVILVIVIKKHKNLLKTKIMKNPDFLKAKIKNFTKIVFLTLKTRLVFIQLRKAFSKA